jgi:glycerate 2-kinase
LVSPAGPAAVGPVLIAPDKFKGSLTAAQVADHVAAGLLRARPSLNVLTLPVADGGDGTVAAAVAAGYQRVRTVVTGPTGEPVTAELALKEGTAVVELAEASGLRRLRGGRSAPLTATSRGTGELIREALRRGAKRIVLGLGGSACTDGGAGLVTALGVRLLDSRGAPLPPGGAALRALRAIDLGGFALPPDVHTVVAGDVDNPLLGRHGAAQVYGPQKGATRQDVRVLEAGLTRWADVVEHVLGRGARDRPGAGAAGGVGFGAMTFLDARLESGIGILLDLLGFAERVRGAQLVITGEGTLDSQTLRGKAPAGVARAGSRAGAPVVAVAGRRALTGEQLRRARFQKAYALTDLEPDVDRCIADAGPLLERLGAIIADEWIPKEPAR